MFLLYVRANVLTLEYRSTWWRKASEANAALVEQLTSLVSNVPGTNGIVLVDSSDHIEYAYTFRNAFPR